MLVKKLKLLLIILIYSGVFAIDASAQSNNYWSWNFNTPSMLLSGAVVGGSAGASAIYYNPALIDHENTPSLSFSASLVTLQHYIADNVVGDNINSKEWFFKVQPKFISYILPSKNKRIGMEVAVFSPVSDESEINIQYRTQLDIIERTEGVEDYYGYLKRRKSFQDIWAGFGLSYSLSEHLYLGASGFLSSKLMDYESSQFMEAYQNAEEVIVDGVAQPKYIALNNYSEELDYWYESLIFKAGIQYKSNSERFSFGLNVTLPAIPIYGEASVRKAFNRSNVYNNQENEFTSNESFVGYQKEVSTKIKSPLSIAIGGQYITENKNLILISVEYFHRIDQYAIISPTLQSNSVSDLFNGISVNDFMSYYHSADNITNVSIGFKKYFSENFFMFGGIRTDFDASKMDDSEDNYKVSQYHLDKYYITAGPVLTIKDATFITGIQFSTASGENLQQLINYGNPVEYDEVNNKSLQGMKEDNVKATIRELSIFLGVTVSF